MLIVRLKMENDTIYFARLLMFFLNELFVLSAKLETEGAFLSDLRIRSWIFLKKRTLRSVGLFSKNRVLCFQASPVKQGYYAQIMFRWRRNGEI